MNLTLLLSRGAADFLLFSVAAKAGAAVEPSNTLTAVSNTRTHLPVSACIMSSPFLLELTLL
jgi:hypothetical protein